MSAWQPIETHPLDEMVLLYPQMVVAFKGWPDDPCFDVEGWIMFDQPLNNDHTIAEWPEDGSSPEMFRHMFVRGNPTHWMPLPEPPQC